MSENVKIPINFPYKFYSTLYMMNFISKSILIEPDRSDLDEILHTDTFTYTNTTSYLKNAFSKNCGRGNVSKFWKMTII